MGCSTVGDRVKRALRSHGESEAGAITMVGLQGRDTEYGPIQGLDYKARG